MFCYSGQQMRSSRATDVPRTAEAPERGALIIGRRRQKLLECGEDVTFHHILIAREWNDPLRDMLFRLSLIWIAFSCYQVQS